MYILVNSLVAVLATRALVAFAQEPCSPANDKLSDQTHDFDSDCNATQYCIPNPSGGDGTTIAGTTAGTCAFRSCRKDEYPFGFGNTTLPPLCNEGEYCPDRGDGCKPRIALNGACELNRDDECAPPADPAVQAQLSSPTNHHGAMCLNSLCVYANIEQGQTCIVSNTVYTGYGDDGTAYTDVVTRDNCVNNHYCDPQSLTCVPSLPVKAPCISDRSCSTSICSTTTGTCSPPPSKPRHTPPVAVAFVVIAVLALLGAMVWSLLKCDRSARERRRAERAAAWAEQRQLRERLGEVLEKKEMMQRDWSRSTGNDSQETLVEKRE
ncbi:uncharacterized protein JCM6883_001784 [Sporobolomyces salmoneus]|uniref:uncharacterized protein n=1 Tax=Sporobolomyces salmoneus TaxID=183962 RepID=UPI003172FA2A